MIAAWTAIFGLGAILLTWPLALHLGTHIPLGSERTPTVPFFNTWTVAWNGLALRTGNAAYWDAPIFYPSPGTFAFSDPQPLTALAAPIASSAPFLAYNLILLAYITLNGMAAAYLLREMRFSAWTAAIGGLLVQFLPFLTHERGVLQLQPLFGPLLALGAAWRCAEDGSRRDAALLGLSFGITFLTSEYYALATIFLIALAFLIHPRFLLARKSWPKLLISAAIALAMSLPAAMPQAERLAPMGFARSQASIEKTSAQAADYLRLSPRLRFPHPDPATEGGSGQPLSPGIGLPLAAAIGIALMMRQGERRRWALWLALMGAIMVALSLGSNLDILGFEPYTAMRAGLPFLRWMRSPFRFALFVQAGLALAAGGAIEALLQRSRRLGLLLGLMLIFELLPLPERLASLDLHPAWARSLARDGAQRVLHLPWPEGSSASAYEQTTAWMLQSLDAGAISVNGYSGFFPRSQRQFRALASAFPSSFSIRLLGDLGVERVVWHLPPERQEEAIQEALRYAPLRPILQTEDALLLSLDALEPHRADQYRGPWSIRATYQSGLLSIRMHAEIPDASVYYANPLRESPSLLISLEGTSETDQIAMNWRDDGILYHGSDLWLTMEKHATLEPGMYTIIVHAPDGRSLGKTTLEVDGD